VLIVGAGLAASRLRQSRSAVAGKAADLDA